MAALTARSFSGAFDPLQLIERWPDRYPALLESGPRQQVRAAQGQRIVDDARFDVVPFATGDALLAASGRGSGDFLQRLACEFRGERFLERAPCESPQLPFRGGWLLFLGYELARQIEPKLVLPPSDEPYEALALRCPAGWIGDRRAQRGWLVCEPGWEHLLDLFERDCGMVDQATGVSGEGARAAAQTLESAQSWRAAESDPQEFLGQVRRCLDYIRGGEIYQANLSRAWRIESDAALNPVDIYRRLQKANPAPFSALLRFRDYAIMSSSPERLMSVSDGRISTRPIAGTRPRARARRADEALLAQLRGSEKERAEHVMLIDLMRNDLGKVCRGGSVQVDELMSIETFAHVHHIVSNVSGELADGATFIDAIRALFPGGTITGCPKFRCMQIIAELEGEGRGAYTGSIGYMNRDGSGDLNILIRTVTMTSRSTQFRAGAGIVADSQPQRELEETRAKALGLIRALGGSGSAAV